MNGLLTFDVLDRLLVPVVLVLIRHAPGRHARTAAHTVRRELHTVIRRHRAGHHDWTEVRPAGWARREVTA
jgi:hypothetical protein